jgi:hypothetical protein
MASAARVVAGKSLKMKILKGGLLYFALVFGAGFALGMIRVLWLVPRVGTRSAEVMEAPVMFVAVIVAARWVVRRVSLPPTMAMRLGVGFIALGFLLATEFTVVLGIRGITINEYFIGRDPVAEGVYVAMLGVFAIMPLLVCRR